MATTEEAVKRIRACSKLMGSIQAEAKPVIVQAEMATAFTHPLDIEDTIVTDRVAQPEASRDYNIYDRGAFYRMAQPEASHGYNIYDRDAFYRMRIMAVTLKTIELILTVLILWTVDSQEEVLLDRSTKFIFIILAADIMISLLTIAGLIAGEVYLRLIVCMNCIGAVLSLLTAALLFYDGRLLNRTSMVCSILVAILYTIAAYIVSKPLPLSQGRRRFVRHTHVE